MNPDSRGSARFQIRIQARAEGLNPTIIEEALTSLEAAGFITREVDKDEAVSYVLTNAGRKRRREIEVGMK